MQPRLETLRAAGGFVCRCRKRCIRAELQRMTAAVREAQQAIRVEQEVARSARRR